MEKQTHLNENNDLYSRNATWHLQNIKNGRDNRKDNTNQNHGDYIESSNMMTRKGIKVARDQSPSCTRSVDQPRKNGNTI